MSTPRFFTDEDIYAVIAISFGNRGWTPSVLPRRVVAANQMNPS